MQWFKPEKIFHLGTLYIAVIIAAVSFKIGF